ncbi:hypothetical protein JCM19235_5067 [Vibrio maritimus]|uniref:Spondin domain-containing protein n=1 Tax=Vibrio maritimus TaxID=990268 RepID=A0A090RPS4_9VIBR|nr:hypothetical protein JCM19235_5067 [Vibrio maritimus]
MKKRTQLGLAITSASLLLGAGSAAAADLEITITNATKGIYFTPLIVAAHNSDLVMFRTGQAASAELESMAEGGDISGLASVIGNAGGVVVEDPASGILNPAFPPLFLWIAAALATFRSVRCYYQPMMALWGWIVGRSRQSLVPTKQHYAVMTRAPKRMTS